MSKGLTGMRSGIVDTVSGKHGQKCGSALLHRLRERYGLLRVE